MDDVFDKDRKGAHCVKFENYDEAAQELFRYSALAVIAGAGHPHPPYIPSSFSRLWASRIEEKFNYC